MDLRMWKEILLQWISACGFLEKNSRTIEESDIIGFYEKFCKHHKTAKALHTTNLITFLKDQYPNFQFTCDAQCAQILNVVDYVYAYSLLLHFACVKHPQEFFHDTCQKLPDNIQQYITQFFKSLLNCRTIKNEELRHAITTIELSQGESFTRHRFCASDNLGIKSTKLSTTTLRMCLVEERSTKLTGLKTQIERERYMKELLQNQIEQYEKKIQQFDEDNIKLHQLIQNLKNDILVKILALDEDSDDDTSMNATEVDIVEMKATLRKEITQKEQEVSKLNDILLSLNAKKNHVRDKLEYAGKKMILCMTNISEIMNKIDKLTTNVENKMKFLNPHKNEFPTNNDTDPQKYSHGGTYITDKILQQKETENRQLREKLTEMRTKQSRLMILIEELFPKYLQEFDINIDNLDLKSSSMEEPTKRIMIFANSLSQISSSYKIIQQKVITLQDENSLLNNKIDCFQMNIDNFKKTVDELESTNSQLLKDNQHQKETLMKYIKQLGAEKLKISKNLENLEAEREMLRISLNTQEKDFVRRIALVRDENTNRIKENSLLKEKNINHIKQVDELEDKLHDLEETLSETITDYDMKIVALNEKLEFTKKELDEHRTIEFSTKDKYRKLYVKHEALKQGAYKMHEHIETMKNNVATKEYEMNKLGCEIVDVHAKNADIAKRLNEITWVYQKDKINSKMALTEKDKHISLLTAKKEKLEDLLIEGRRMYEKLRDKSLDLERELEESAQKVNKIKMLLDLAPVGDNMINELQHIIDKLQKMCAFKAEKLQKLKTRTRMKLKTHLKK